MSDTARRINIPRECDWFASIDWGFNSPGCCLWWVCLPDGHYHIAAEHKFQYKTAETVAGELVTMTKDLIGSVRALRYIACDPSMKAKTGHGRGESIMETLQRRQLAMRPSDNDRMNGWLRVHELLAIAPDGTPWLTVEPTCKYLVRTLPSQMSDKRDPDDINTGGDDHAVDALRYGAMSRPAPTRFGPVVKTLHPWLEDALAGSIVRPVLGSSNVRPRHVP